MRSTTNTLIVLVLILSAVGCATTPPNRELYADFRDMDVFPAMTPFCPRYDVFLDVPRGTPVCVVFHDLMEAQLDTIYNDTCDGDDGVLIAPTYLDALPSGVYRYEVTLPDTTFTKKMILLK